MLPDTHLAALRYRQAEDIVSREIAGEVLLVPIRNNVGDLESIYTLNDTGALIWGLMDSQHTLGDICAVLVEDFEVTQEQAWSDLLGFVRDLESLRALVKD